MKVKYIVMSAQEIVNLVLASKLNPNPIGQRPPTSQGHNKSIHIVKSVLEGYGVGQICLRYIKEDPEMQKVYPGMDYLVIDGGHRVRALVNYYCNKFAINKLKYNQSGVDLANFNVSVEITTCTSREAIEKFRRLNESTPVTFMEMLMCDDESNICRIVRSVTREYFEYKNVPHPLFDTTFNKKGEEKSVWFDMAPNHRRKWDEYVFIAILKTLGGGNVDAGEREITQLIEREYNNPDTNIVSKNVAATLDRFFTDILNICEVRGKSRKLTTDVFAAMQLVWFGLYEHNRNFKIADYEEFHDYFMQAYARLTGSVNTDLNDSTITYNNQQYFIKEFVRKNSSNFSNSGVQKKCAECFLEEMGDPQNFGVIFREEKRSMTADQREQLLAVQNYKCAIDGKRLTVEESVLGHDTPWAKGGRVADGAVIRRSHNVDMGSITIDEYRMVLQMRGAI